MFRVIVEEVLDQQDPGDQGILIKRYEQTVADIDLRAVMAAVNKRPRKPRAKKGNQQADLIS